MRWATLSWAGQNKKLRQGRYGNDRPFAPSYTNLSSELEFEGSQSNLLLLFPLVLNFSTLNIHPQSSTEMLSNRLHGRRVGNDNMSNE